GNAAARATLATLHGSPAVAVAVEVSAKQKLATRYAWFRYPSKSTPSAAAWALNTSSSRTTRVSSIRIRRALRTGDLPGPGSLLRRRGEVPVDPGLDVRHDAFLVDVVEQVVEAALIELQRFVLRTSQVVETLAPRRPRGLVGCTVDDQDRHGEFREAPRQTVRGLQHL